MINNYIIEGETVKLKIIRRNGDVYYTLIDLEDLEKIIKLDLPCHVKYDACVDGYYARFTKYKGLINGKPKYETIILHRFVTDAKEDDIVDHINHDTLDNRKENLRVTETIKNTKHRSGANANNKSGYRNVSKVGNKWYVQLQINGVNTCLKKFPLDQLEQAGAYAKEMRQYYYGEFAGEG